MSKVEARAREQQLILENMGLVVSLARSFNPKNNQELEEYIQSGRIGLWKAIKKYDDKLKFVKLNLPNFLYHETIFVSIFLSSNHDSIAFRQKT